MVEVWVNTVDLREAIMFIKKEKSLKVAEINIENNLLKL